MEVIDIGAIFIGLFCLVFFGLFGFVFWLIAKEIRKSVRQNRWNRQQPLITLSARVVAKRTSVSGGGENSSASTTYYATFETEGAERQEFLVPGKEYGLLVEGDIGTLSHQGTWYKGFERRRIPVRVGIT